MVRFYNVIVIIYKERRFSTMSDVNNYEYTAENLDKLVTSVVELLLYRGVSISTAESCTGGLLSELITSVAGASEIFQLGICTYSEQMKTEFLGVSPDILRNYGVVSYETALAMAAGLKKISGADICVSVTGIAGPGGGTPEKPVGTVFTGFDIFGRQTASQLPFSKITDNSRSGIRMAAAFHIFETIKNALTEAQLPE